MSPTAPHRRALPPERCQIVQADIEGSPWPLTGRLFAAVVVTNYLWRPLLPTLLDSLAKGGVMIYETFASGHETIGRPSRPDFLLKPGELLKVFEDLRVVAFEDGFCAYPKPAMIQRLCAVKPPFRSSEQARLE